MPFMDDLREYKTRILRSLWESDSIRRIISESANIPDLTYEQFRFYVRIRSRKRAFIFYLK